MTRREVDNLCLSGMLDAGGVSAIRRGTIWAQVRLWGWAAWPGAPR
jgi:hypothetical protein